MRRVVDFANTVASDEYSSDTGLDGLTTYFAIRALTQLRPTTDMPDTEIRVMSDDGLELDLLEIGSFGWHGDVLYDTPVSVAKVLDPSAGGCAPHALPPVSLSAGKIYTLGLKYWQGNYDKCLQVCSTVAGSSPCLHHAWTARF